MNSPAQSASGTVVAAHQGVASGAMQESRSMPNRTRPLSSGSSPSMTPTPPFFAVRDSTIARPSAFARVPQVEESSDFAPPDPFGEYGILVALLLPSLPERSC